MHFVTVVMAPGSSSVNKHRVGYIIIDSSDANASADVMNVEAITTASIHNAVYIQVTFWVFNIYFIAALISFYCT